MSSKASVLFRYQVALCVSLNVASVGSAQVSENADAPVIRMGETEPVAPSSLYSQSQNR